MVGCAISRIQQILKVGTTSHHLIIIIDANFSLSLEEKGGRFTYELSLISEKTAFELI